MFLIRIFALITLSALSITSAFAENSPMYFGLGYANARIKAINTSGTNTSHEADMYRGVLEFSYDFNN